MTKVLLLVLAALISTTYQSCSKKEARKSQRARLKKLNEDHAVVIAEFLFNDDGLYKFGLVETWPNFNAGLDKRNEGAIITVRVPENFRDCERKIRIEEQFYLILQKDSSDEKAEFKLLEPLVPSKMPRIRKHVHTAVCNQEKGCPKLAVKIPNDKIVNTNFVDVTTCRVQTELKKDAYKVEWFYENKTGVDNLVKNSEDIVTKESNEGLSLYLKTKYEHSTFYTCKVTITETGEQYKQTLEIFVKSQHETLCEPEYCNNHGKCLINPFNDEDQRKSCICDSGFDGNKCHQRAAQEHNPNVLGTADVTPFPASGSAVVGSLIVLSVLVVAAALLILKRVRSTESKVVLLLESRKKYMSDKTRKMIFQGVTTSSVNSSKTPILASSLNNSMDNFNISSATRSFTPSSTRSVR